MKMKVAEYEMRASNGKHIRIATKVILEDGSEMRFIDRLSKREALKQATEQILRTRKIETGLCPLRLAINQEVA